MIIFAKNKKLLPYKTSLYAFWTVLIGIIVIGLFFYPKWELDRTEALLSWDTAGYYAYLPSTFIYHDLKDMKKTEQKAQEYNNGFEAFHAPNGRKITKYAIGQAVLLRLHFSSLIPSQLP